MNLPSRTKRQIGAVLMFFIAVIVVLSFFDLAGMGGDFFLKTLSFLIGKTVFIIPLLFALGGLAFLSSRPKMFWLSICLGIFILILGISGILGGREISQNQELQKFIWNYSGQGGWIGYLISWPVFYLFGFWTNFIVFLTVIIIGSLILLQFLWQREKASEDGKPAESPADIQAGKSLVSQIFKKATGEPQFKIKEISPSEKEKAPPSSKEALSLGLEAKPLKRETDSFYPVPSLDLLESDKGGPTSGDIQANSTIIRRTLENFGIPVEMSEVNIGPTVTQYTFKPSEGIKLARITALSNDLALALAAHPIRIEAPIPGRSLVGIEIPNKVRAFVRLRNLIGDQNFQKSVSPLLLCLGRDVAGTSVYADLVKMPHLLVAGSTGSGKTICLNNLILSLLYRNSPQTLKLILVDPKRVEFETYTNLPHLLTPVIYDVQKTVNALRWLIKEMERRFEVLSEAETKNIALYNEKAMKKSLDPMPNIVLIIDELADLMAASTRDIEAAVVRLAQMARAVGIHLIVATQRPSVEVITGLIKANITSRITFQVASQVDSRTILDMAGAEKLLGLGDMLFISSELAKPRRIQAAFVSEKEVKRVAEWIESKTQLAKTKTEEITERDITEGLDEAIEFSEKESVYEQDPLYEEAKRVIIEARKASASLLQRRLRVGYARAARLIDMLEEKGVVGPADGAKPREILLGQPSQLDISDQSDLS
ncbi:hypothetical protein AMJ49_04485 [Parcubacteria bacterium DG_74_2]|nr:MAG: hypothetical protein AMJ49_04485 [Parcubacteria bacterium DG_74_2]